MEPIPFTSLINDNCVYQFIKDKQASQPKIIVQINHMESKKTKILDLELSQVLSDIPEEKRTSVKKSVKWLIKNHYTVVERANEVVFENMTFGPDKEESAKKAFKLTNLGKDCEAAEEYDNALKFHRQALHIRRQLIGGDLLVAISLNHLGAVHGALGNYEEAKKHYLKAIQIQEKFPDARASMAISLSNLGTINEMQGNLKAAKDYHCLALAIRKDLFGGCHESVRASLSNLAGVEEALGNNKAAEQYFREAKRDVDVSSCTFLSMDESCLVS